MKGIFGILEKLGRRDHRAFNILSLLDRFILRPLGNRARRRASRVLIHSLLTCRLRAICVIKAIFFLCRRWEVFFLRGCVVKGRASYASISVSGKVRVFGRSVGPNHRGRKICIFIRDLPNKYGRLKCFYSRLFVITGGDVSNDRVAVNVYSNCNSKATVKRNIANCRSISFLCGEFIGQVIRVNVGVFMNHGVIRCLRNFRRAFPLECRSRTLFLRLANVIRQREITFCNAEVAKRRGLVMFAVLGEIRQVRRLNVMSLTRLLMLFCFLDGRRIGDG